MVKTFFNFVDIYMFLIFEIRNRSAKQIRKWKTPKLNQPYQITFVLIQMYHFFKIVVPKEAMKLRT